MRVLGDEDVLPFVQFDVMLHKLSLSLPLLLWLYLYLWAELGWRTHYERRRQHRISVSIFMIVNLARVRAAAGAPFGIGFLLLHCYRARVQGVQIRNNRYG